MRRAPGKSYRAVNHTESSHVYNSVGSAILEKNKPLDAGRRPNDWFQSLYGCSIRLTMLTHLVVVVLIQLSGEGSYFRGMPKAQPSCLARHDWPGLLHDSIL